MTAWSATEGEGQDRFHVVNIEGLSIGCLCLPVTMNDMEEGPNEVSGWVDGILGQQYLPARIIMAKYHS